MNGVDVSEVMISANEIKAMVEHTAALINKDYGDEELLVIGILTGSFIFAADLIRHLTMPVKIDFMQVSSYQGQTSTGVLTLLISLKDVLTRSRLIIRE